MSGVRRITCSERGGVRLRRSHTTGSPYRRPVTGYNIIKDGQMSQSISSVTFRPKMTCLPKRGAPSKHGARGICHICHITYVRKRCVYRVRLSSVKSVSLTVYTGMFPVGDTSSGTLIAVCVCVCVCVCVSVSQCVCLSADISLYCAKNDSTDYPEIVWVCWV